MTEPVKQRLLVMNGQRLLQTAQAGEWATQKVDKAGAMKPGIYDLHLSTPADKSQKYDGTILYADKSNIYQKVAKNYIKHDRHGFAKIPEAGASVNISYEGEKAIVSTSTVKLVNGRSR